MSVSFPSQLHWKQRRDLVACLAFKLRILPFVEDLRIIGDHHAIMSEGLQISLVDLA